MVNNPPANSGDVRDAGLIPGLERSPEGGNGNPLQDSCLGNPMDRGAQQARVHDVANSWTQLSTHGLFWNSLFLVQYNIRTKLNTLNFLSTEAINMMGDIIWLM